MTIAEKLRRKVDEVDSAGINTIEARLKECLLLAEELQKEKVDDLDEFAKNEVIPNAIRKLITAEKECSNFQYPLTAQTKGNTVILKEIQKDVKITNKHLVYILCDGEEGIYFLPDNSWFRNENHIKLVIRGGYVIGLVNGDIFKIKPKTRIYDVYSQDDLEYIEFPEHLEERKKDVLEILRKI
ncbi:hypothetical protein [Aureispira sp. CCB-E]|uniref:hypothetical protein n=1 Tax=Aureispira sp. CCB-E TaxID=3051121 RepID=UPI00286918B9|nr:hypothetical protein [Aureispira sp. CCB-E]WMX14725.1 hypothetical protein QP953_28105 [Aureispira sp. CCB-E]